MGKSINVEENNPRWKGGVTITPRGYRKLLAKDHPRKDRDGYVFEHILVVEDKIGRLLLEGEVVHHINGKKLDNSPENLILFSSQAEHIRYESDLRGRKTSDVKCDTCGKIFNKRNAAIKKFNFCCVQHMNPRLWSH